MKKIILLFTITFSLALFSIQTVQGQPKQTEISNEVNQTNQDNTILWIFGGIIVLVILLYWIGKSSNSKDKDGGGCGFFYFLGCGSNGGDGGCSGGCGGCGGCGG